MAETNTLENLTGKLNQEVEKNTYQGGSTGTADVYVDNTSNTIYVNTRIDTREVEKEYIEVQKELQETREKYDEVKATETELIGKVGSLDVRVTEAEAKIDQEVLDRQAADQALKTELTQKIDETKSDLEQKVATEITERKAADTVLGDSIDSLRIELGDEVTRATTKEAELKADIEDEVSARESADDALSVRIDGIDVIIDEKLQPLEGRMDTAEADIAGLKTGKLDIMPGDEYTAGNAYNLPYFFKTEADGSKIKVTAETVSLDGKKTHGSYSLDVNSATQEKAGLLSAADKAKLDNLDGGYAKKEELEAEVNRAKGIEAGLQNQIDNIGTVIEEHLVPVEQRVTTLTGQVQDLGNRVDILDDDVGALAEAVAKKASTDYVDQSVAVIASQLAGKGSSMYYDASGEFDPSGESYWYMVNVAQGETVTAENIIGGPYEFGTGGGGGSISEVTIDDINWPKACQFGGTCPITITWNSIKGERITGNGTIAIYVNDVLKATYRNRPQGELTFEVGEYLEKGTNLVEVRAIDAYGTMDKVVNEITAIVILLESTFDGTLPYTGTVNYTYVPTGSLTKYVKFYVDGSIVATDVVKTSGDQQTHQFTGWTHGHHKLEVFFTCDIEGAQISSNKLVYDLIYYVEGDKTPIIASTFNSLVQEQYVAFTIPYIAYTPDKAESEVTLKVYNAGGTEFEQTVTVGQEQQLWEYRSNKADTYNFKITTGGVDREFVIEIKESEIKVEPVKENLALELGVVGRSNTEPHPEIWEDAAHGVSCTLSNFNFTSDGWVKDSEGNTILRITGDARVDIPYQPFLADCKSVGKTIEIEFATSEVRNYSAEIISCMADNRGIYITPQIGRLQSQQSALQTPYKEDDHVRLAFVIEKNVETRLILMYVNGIMSGAVQYPENDNFRQLNPVNISLGTNEATLDIYSIRIYDNNLTRKQIVNNWIAETQSGALKTERYLHNDNYNDSGEIVISKLPKDLPYMVATIAELPTFKGDKRVADLISYTDLVMSSQSFNAFKAQMNVQGTSSQYYFRKNFKISYKGGFTQGATTNPKYPIRPGAIPEKEFTYKADVASSEGANNVELVRYFQDSKNWKTPAEKLNSKCRVGIDGFPMVFFHNDGEKTYFYGKMNFNNDKGNKDTYGFLTNYSEEGVYVDGDESWEITNNNTPQVLFHSDDLSDWKASFESRFPDDNTPDGHTFGDNAGELDRLQAMVSWVVSTYRKDDDSETVKAAKLKKFREELTNFFDLQSTLFYYLYTELFLLVDSRAKNCFPTYMKSRIAGDGGDKWFWFPYDMDTAIGINNEGSLVFGYNLEDTDTVDGALVYNGQRSAMWCNVRDAFAPELEALYKSLRSGSASELAWTYKIIEDRFEEHQNKWSETIFNEDAYSKYILPLIQQKDDQYLSMLQGSKAEQRKWWLFNRFNYIDSKYQTGNALASTIMLRAYAKSDFHIVTYSDLYLTGNFDDQIVHFRADRDQGYTMLSPASWDPKGTDAVVSLYSANQLKEIGDLSGFMVGKGNFSAATKLQKIIVGSDAEGYINEKLTELGVGNNNMLQVVNAKNCINLKQAVDLRGCANIEEVYFDNTQITGCLLPNGGILKKLHLPNTLTNLTLRNQKSLNELVLDGTQNIQSLWLENIPNEVIDPRTFINNMPDGSAVRVVGFRQTFDHGADIRTFYNKLDKMHGIDAQGREVEKAQMNGIIDIDSIYYSDYEELKLRYTDITINAKHIKCLVRFYNEGQLHDSQYVDKGGTALRPVDPTKPSTQQHYYTFEGWDKPLDNIQADTDINAIFSEHLQVYEVKFNTQTEAVVVPSQFIEYGSKATKPADPVLPGSRFDGWFEDPEGITAYNFDTPITGPKELYAKWTDTEAPSVSITVTSYNQFSYTLKDNINVVGYALTRTEEEPTEWTSITPTPEYTGTYQIVEAGSYFVWALDQSGKSGYAQVNAYTLSKSVSEGAYITITEGSTVINVGYALQTTNLSLSYGCDIHYENFVFKINDVESTATEIRVTENLAFTASCTPKSYLVQFNKMGKGADVPSQTIVYNNLATRPDEQYVSGQIIENWYMEDTFETVWNFNTDKVDHDMTLYAKWVPYSAPTELDYTISSLLQKVIIEVYNQVKVSMNIDWGDGTVDTFDFTSTSTWTAEHEYTATGDYKVKITNPSGNVYSVTAGQRWAKTEIIETLIKVKCSYSVSSISCEECPNLIDIELTPYIASISDHSFRGCEKLTNIKLYEGLKYIGDEAFRRTSLTELIIPDSVEKTGFQVCQNVTTLTKVYIGKNLDLTDNFQNGIFYGCTSLEEVTFAEGCKLSCIPSSMFYNCVRLKSIELPPSVKTIKNSAFGSSGLKSIDVPASVELITEYAFAACNSLEKVYLRSSKLLFGNGYNFNNSPLLKSVGPLGSDANIEFAWTTAIPDNAFNAGYSQGTIMRVTLPSTLTSIGDNAFYQQVVSAITFPAVLESIGASAFQRNALQSVIIPRSVTNIGTGAFQYCNSLLVVQLKSVGSKFKCESYAQAWFAYTEPYQLQIHASRTLDETSAKVAFGDCWNMYDATRYLPVDFDLEV